MSCELISGIAASCEYSASGVEKIWLANKADVTGDTYNADLEVTGLTATPLYEFVPALDSGTFQDDLVVNGSRRNFLQTINFALDKMSAATLATIEDLGLSNMVAFIKDAEGNFRVFGLKSTGLRATVMTETSGTASGNDGAVNVTISGSSTSKARFVESTLATSLGLS